MRELGGKVAAVTGAGSGIGRALAVRLASQGCELALCDVDERGLEETRCLVATTASRVSTHGVDVGDPAQLRAWAEETRQRHHRVDLLINNAGVGMTMALAETRLEDFEWIMRINFWGVVHGCAAFLPLLAQRPQAHICNVASVFSLFTYPGAGAYCASKSAVRAYTGTLAQELAGGPIEVSCVLPGGIRTPFARHARYPERVGDVERAKEAEDFERRIARTSPERAADVIVRGIRRGRGRILVGSDAHAFDVLSRLLPVSWERLVGHVGTRGRKGAARSASSPSPRTPPWVGPRGSGPPPSRP